MFRIRCIALALVILIMTAAPTALSQSKQEDPLDSLKFLEGAWHGDGKSPYGAYEFEATNERRRWFLGTSSNYALGTSQLLVVATGLTGYDEKGLVMYSFDNSGVTVLRGQAIEGGVRFEWRDGEAYRLRTLRRLPDGKISNREESYLPAVSKDKLVFESVSMPGKRQSK